MEWAFASCWFLQKWLSVMAAIRGILVRQFGGPEVLEYVHHISSPCKPTGRQVCAIVSTTQYILELKIFR